MGACEARKVRVSAISPCHHGSCSIASCFATSARWNTDNSEYRPVQQISGNAHDDSYKTDHRAVKPKTLRAVRYDHPDRLVVTVRLLVACRANCPGQPDPPPTSLAQRVDQEYLDRMQF
ncbi:hypothetical protein BT67DRAFT_145553 [Trichocladium antarcticum]|uniref:Uncharacterized protein n=1 Tax=Trichocladium antarcticum TaxID=1450529 RepID=A0AAN6UFH1_9PEZI|nr:hypothetical protein BT67DRAFT_145553 [Trichocladium antarcticum]